MQISFAQWALLIGAMMPFFVVAITKFTKDYDNADPRRTENIQSPLRRRAYAAHKNCFEAYPFFASAVLLALFAGIDRDWLDLVALLWVGFRVLFVVVYLADKAGLRTIVWWLANLCSIAIFLKILL